jgi:hypothetical protein
MESRAQRKTLDYVKPWMELGNRYRGNGKDTHKHRDPMGDRVEGDGNSSPVWIPAMEAKTLVAIGGARSFSVVSCTFLISGVFAMG